MTLKLARKLAKETKTIVYFRQKTGSWGLLDKPYKFRSKEKFPSGKNGSWYRLTIKGIKRTRKKCHMEMN